MFLTKCSTGRQFNTCLQTVMTKIEAISIPISFNQIHTFFNAECQPAPLETMLLNTDS